MLDNENIISTSASEAVEKIPTDENDYLRCSFIVFCFAQPKHTKSRPTYIIASSTNSCLRTMIHPVQLKNHVLEDILEDILHNIFTEKGATTCTCLVLSTVEVRKKEFTGFQVAPS